MLITSFSKKNFLAKQCRHTVPVEADNIDNDCDGKIDEEQRDRRDNDRDGRIDEDLGRVTSLFCE